MLTIIIFFLIGISVSQSKIEINSSTYFQQPSKSSLLAEITGQPIEKENSILIKANINQNSTDLTTGKAFIYLKKSDQSKSLNHGDLLTIKNTFKPLSANKNPYEFDYSRYLRIHSIYHQAYATDDQWELVKKGELTWYGLILSIRKTLDDWLTHSSLSSQNQKVAKALLLGEKEYLDPATLKSFSSAGAMHVLAVSGLHVGIIMLILQFVLKPIKKWRFGNTLYTVLIICGVWFYALVTGFSPSVIRAALMFSFIVFGRGLQRQNSVYQSIFVSALVILLFDPFSLFKVGFQLSYLAVLGIVFFQPRIYRAFYFRNKIADYIWKISSVSIAAQLATFPLGLYYFHQFPNLFLISNIIVIPLAGILLCLGFAYFATHFIVPLRHVLEYILDLLFTFLNKSMSAIEAIPNSLLLGVSISWIEVFLIYGIIITFTMGFISRSKRIFVFSLLLTTVFLGIQVSEKIDISNQKHLTVYNIKKDFALDMFTGNNNTFIATNSLLKNDSKLLFHIKHHWYRNRGNKAPANAIIIDSLENPVFTVNADDTFCIINTPSAPLPIAELVLLYQMDFVPAKALNKWTENQSILVLHPDLPYKTSNYLKREYPKELLFDIKTEGAFQVNYK